MQDMYVAYSWMAVSVAGLAGFWLWLHYRHRDRSKTQSHDVEQLEATVQALQADLDAVATESRAQIEHLEARVDFAERLLTAKSDEPLRADRGLGRVPTPV
ncbi:MAG: hypothetical protein ACKVZ0_05955 [Gemmatimonadales bacterium]